MAKNLTKVITLGGGGGESNLNVLDSEELKNASTIVINFNENLSVTVENNVTSVDVVISDNREDNAAIWSAQKIIETSYSHHDFGNFEGDI